MAKRRDFSAAIRATVALEALAGEATPTDLSARHKGHPNLITKGKRQAADGAVGVFSCRSAWRDGPHEAEIKELHAKIGELTVERDILSKAFGRRAAAGGWR